MDMLNTIPYDDTDYSNWNDADYVNDVLDYLFKHNSSPSTLSQINSTKKLPDTKKKLIQSLVIETNLTNHKPSGYWEQFKISNEGYVIINKYSSYKKYLRVNEHATKTDSEIKHEILRFLREKKVDSFELADLISNIHIDEERIIYIIHEMNNDGTIGINDVSTEEDGIDYLIWIEPKGLGFFAKSEYLKPKKDNSSLVNITDSILNLQSDLKKSQQSTGSSFSQRMNVSAPAKVPIISKIIIGILIGLAVLIIGHYVFGIG